MYVCACVHQAFLPKVERIKTSLASLRNFDDAKAVLAEGRVLEKECGLSTEALTKMDWPSHELDAVAAILEAEVTHAPSLGINAFAYCHCVDQRADVESVGRRHSVRSCALAGQYFSKVIYIVALHTECSREHSLLRIRVRHVDADDKDGSKLRKSVKLAIETLEVGPSSCCRQTATFIMNVERVCVSVSLSVSVSVSVSVSWSVALRVLQQCS